mgnify:CR=1 FL=1
MNFNGIFLFKLKLDLGLMEIKAIQDWADAKILNDQLNYRIVNLKEMAFISSLCIK